MVSHVPKEPQDPYSVTGCITLVTLNSCPAKPLLTTIGSCIKALILSFHTTKHLNPLIKCHTTFPIWLLYKTIITFTRYHQVIILYGHQLLPTFHGILWISSSFSSVNGRWVVHCPNYAPRLKYAPKSAIVAPQPWNYRSWSPGLRDSHCSTAHPVDKIIRS